MLENEGHSGRAADSQGRDQTGRGAGTGTTFPLPLSSGGGAGDCPHSPQDAVWRTHDPRPLPEWVRGFREHQSDAVDEILEAYDRGVSTVIVDAPTGCLDGDTELVINRGGKGYRTTIREAYEKSHGRRDLGKGWDLTIPTFVAQGDLHDGVVVSREAHAFVFSGLKRCVTVRLEDGHNITLTPDHRVMTEQGWVPAGDLTRRHRVAVNIGRVANKSRKPKAHYPRNGGLKHHPHAVMPGDPKNGWVVPRHRLVVEADMNDLSFDQYLERLRRGPVDGLQFLPPDMIVHHRDENPQNYQLDNLEVMTVTQHHQHHANYAAVAEQLGWVRIKSVVDAGPRLTFDIQMVDEPHFLANGIYVHNSGKTLIAEMVRRRVADRTVYTCHSLGLQDQMLRDYPYAAVLKGRANYPTQTMPWPEVTCADCTYTGTGSACMWCTDVEGCEYRVARAQGLASRLTVVNSAYLLAEMTGRNSGLRGRDLIVIDEVDTLETTLSGVVEYRVSEWAARQMRVTIPKKGSHLTTIIKWVRDEIIPAATRERSKVNGTGVEAIRSRTRWTRLISDTRRLVTGIVDQLGTADGTGWVRDNNQKGLVLKPVRVGPWGPERVWRHADRWLLMSGTIISARQLVNDLGIPGIQGKDWATIEVPMTFPVENRPIIAVPVADMTYKGREVAWPRMVEGVRAVMRAHPDVKILVHTVSYKLAEYLHNELAAEGARQGRELYTYTRAADRDPTVEAYRASENGILFAASVDRGFDFPGDDTRVVVVAKIPYPNLGDRVVAERVRGDDGQTWFDVQTVRSLVQMTGRAVRSADDWCVSYILDAQFYRNTLKGQAGRLLPRWWHDGLRQDVSPRELLKGDRSWL